MLQHQTPATAPESVKSAQMDVDSVGNDDRSTRATSVLSLDDIEAAQTLEGLRSEFTVTSPPSLNAGQSSTPVVPGSESQQPEPILSLLTSSHPLLSTAINGSVSMYTSSKSYSPRFKTGAEFIERNIGSRVVNTVGNVGRRTGVEGGLRWVLQRRESSDPSAANTGNARSLDAMDIEKGIDIKPSHTRRSSGLSIAETLPPYDTHSSPNYEELTALDSGATRSQQGTWPSRLMISTSGLGVAMSEESLRSLTYCLKWLKWANTRLGNSIIILRRVLEEWEAAKQQQLTENGNSGAMPRSTAALAQQIQQIKQDVLQTLKQVVDVVSKYAGGALPENARNLVRRHLTSLPQRFRIASTSPRATEVSDPQSDTPNSAQRVLVLAVEGLDMMAQVSGVVNDTLVSAEGWCDKLRRSKPSTNSENQGSDVQLPPLDVKAPVPEPAQREDVEMSGMNEKS